MIEVGDYVRANGNYWDEQLGEYAYTGIQKVIDVTADRFGRGIKVDHERDEWIDDGWFEKVDKPRIVIAAVKCDGIVFTGLRHGHIIRDMVGCGYLTDIKEGPEKTKDQGFVDNHNRYFNREEARVIAIEAGQIDKDHGTLYSEDLW